jgi:CDP-paratose 2-epimerase
MALEQKAAFSSGKMPEAFTIAGTGKQVRDILHVDDAVKLYLAAFQNRNNIAGQIFNIGGGVENSLSLLELFNLLSEILDMPQMLYTKKTRRSSDQDCFICANDKSFHILDWAPSISSRDGLIKMLAWTTTTQQESPRYQL